MLKTKKITALVEHTKEVAEYFCDACGKETGDVSISLRLDGGELGEEDEKGNPICWCRGYPLAFHWSGIARRPKKEGDPWIKGKDVLCGKWLHFCDGTCAGEYFNKLMRPMNRREKLIVKKK